MSVVAIVQARMGSARLPGKVMRDFCGMPMLAFQVRRLQRASTLDRIVIATSDQPADDAIAAWAGQEGLACYRGSEQDVLGRFAAAAAAYDASIIVRVTGDNPLIDPDIVDRVVRSLSDPAVQHVSTFARPSYPFGLGCAAFRRATLDEAAANAASPYEREHVEPYMLESGAINTLHLQAPPGLHRPEIHVTVDEEVDFRKVERAARAITAGKGIGFTAKDVIDWFDDISVLVVANGRVGLEAVRFLRKRDERICGLVVHPEGRATLRNEIIEASGLSPADILSPSSLKTPEAISWIGERKPEIITSFWSRYIFPKALIDMAPRGITNLHNSLLPWARGGEANIWTIIDGHPAGVTYHYVTEAIDEGPVIAQRPVDVRSWDTGESLFLRLEAALIDLFKEAWPRVRVGPVRATPQAAGGSYRGYRAADSLRRIELDRTYTGRELINLLRALSFPPYEGAHFIDEDGVKVDMRLCLRPMKEDGQLD